MTINPKYFPGLSMKGKMQALLSYHKRWGRLQQSPGGWEAHAHVHEGVGLVKTTLWPLAGQ